MVLCRINKKVSLIITKYSLLSRALVQMLLERVVKKLTGDSGDIGCRGGGTDITDDGDEGDELVALLVVVDTGVLQICKKSTCHSLSCNM